MAKLPSIEELVIDKDEIDVSKKHLPSLDVAMDNKKVMVHVMDGAGPQCIDTMLHHPHQRQMENEDAKQPSSQASSMLAL